MSGPLTPQQRILVRRTFTHVAPYHADVARLFYYKLFEIAPHLRTMFAETMDAQREKVMQMLAALVSAMEHSDHFTRMAHELGRRHVGYGVLTEQYALVGQAMMWALEEACPQIMTPAAIEAWTIAYQMIADAAIDGAQKYDNHVER